MRGSRLAGVVLAGSLVAGCGGVETSSDNSEPSTAHETDIEACAPERTVVGTEIRQAAHAIDFVSCVVGGINTKEAEVTSPQLSRLRPAELSVTEEGSYEVIPHALNDINPDDILLAMVRPNHDTIRDPNINAVANPNSKQSSTRNTLPGGQQVVYLADTIKVTPVVMAIEMVHQVTHLEHTTKPAAQACLDQELRMLSLLVSILELEERNMAWLEDNLTMLEHGQGMPNDLPYFELEKFIESHGTENLTRGNHDAFAEYMLVALRYMSMQQQDPKLEAFAQSFC